LAVESKAKSSLLDGLTSEKWSDWAFKDGWIYLCSNGGEAKRARTGPAFYALQRLLRLHHFPRQRLTAFHDCDSCQCKRPHLDSLCPGHKRWMSYFVCSNIFPVNSTKPVATLYSKNSLVIKRKEQLGASNLELVRICRLPEAISQDNGDPECAE